MYVLDADKQKTSNRVTAVEGNASVGRISREKDGYG